MADEKVEAPLPDIRVLERRLQYPFGEPETAISLTNGWKPRWFNSVLSPDRIWRAKQKGWQPVPKALLSDPEQLRGHTVSPEGYVTRGERHEECLMMMDPVWYGRIEKAKTEANIRMIRDPGSLRRGLTEAAGAAHGDVPKTATIDLKLSKERIERLPEDGSAG